MLQLRQKKDHFTNLVLSYFVKKVKMNVRTTFLFDLTYFMRLLSGTKNNSGRVKKSHR